MKSAGLKVSKAGAARPMAEEQVPTHGASSEDSDDVDALAGFLDALGTDSGSDDDWVQRALPSDDDDSDEAAPPLAAAEAAEAEEAVTSSRGGAAAREPHRVGPVGLEQVLAEFRRSEPPRQVVSTYRLA